MTQNLFPHAKFDNGKYALKNLLHALEPVGQHDCWNE